MQEQGQRQEPIPFGMTTKKPEATAKAAAGTTTKAAADASTPLRSGRNDKFKFERSS
jgi:hypothetical protein